MRKELIKQWDKNKGKLEDWFLKTPQKEYDNYLTILKKILELVLTDKKYMLDNITEIQSGSYMGIFIFIIPEDTIHAPEETEHLFTWVGYGTCSQCDALVGIHKFEEGLPIKEQVNDYMKLSLHIIQHMKKLWEEEE